MATTTAFWEKTLKETLGSKIHGFHFIVIGNIIMGNHDFKGNVDPSNYVITNFNNTSSSINWKYAKTYEISIKILRLSTPFVISPLTYICNKFLSFGVFPERIKYAIIKPVYRKVNKLLTANYRPISLLTPFSKIFEKLIYSRSYKQKCTNNILVKEQYGFRINSSTEAASLDVINETLKAINNRLLV